MEYEESEDPHQLREQREEGGFVTVYSPATAVQSTVTESSIPAVPPKPLLPVSVETPMVESKLDEGNASIIILENPAPPPQGFLSTTGVPAAGSSGGRSFVPYDPNAKPKKQNRRKKAGTSKENSASSLATDATSATESLKSEVPEKQDDQHSPTVATEQTASAPNAEEVVSAVPDSETSGTHEQTPMPSIPATTAADASRFWATLYPPSHLVHPSSGQPTVGSAANSNAAARTSTYLVGTGHVPTVYPPNSPYAPMSWQGVMRGPDQPVYGTPYYPTYAQYYPPWPPISAGTANPPPAKKRKKGGAGKKASRAASVASVSTEEQTASASKEASATGKGKNREASDRQVQSSSSTSGTAADPNQCTIQQASADSMHLPPPTDGSRSSYSNASSPTNPYLELAPRFAPAQEQHSEFESDSRSASTFAAGETFNPWKQFKFRVEMPGVPKARRKAMEMEMNTRLRQQDTLAASTPQTASSQWGQPPSLINSAWSSLPGQVPWIPGSFVAPSTPSASTTFGVEDSSSKVTLAHRHCSLLAEPLFSAHKVSYTILQTVHTRPLQCVWERRSNRAGPSREQSSNV